jgi:para-nitrobenzyl esterase
MNRVNRLLLLATLVAASLSIAMSRAPSKPELAPEFADVTQGRLHGAVHGNTVAFKGVPFAAPPVGALRWRAPAPAPSWSGVLDARKEKPECAQPLTLGEHPRMAGSEDCLKLDLWAPRDAGAGALPVLVFIHGGFFSRGASDMPVLGANLFDGTKLSERGHAVVVSISYRVAALGFLAHPALSSENSGGVSGNYGILDQLAALRWVRDNVAAFGGDPAKVTIFGESAGAASVLILASSPLSRGLFRAAIAESPYLTQPTLANA